MSTDLHISAWLRSSAERESTACGRSCSVI